jgi:hypothetical protein
MRLEHHIAFSAAFSGILYAVFRSWEMSLSSLLAGVLMDVDHLLDYLLEYGKPFNVRKFFRASYEGEYLRYFLLLHVWEWLPLFAVCAWWSGWNSWITGFCLGWVQHMVLDQTFNRGKLWAYFLIGRWKHKSDYRLAFPKDKV